MGLPFLNPQILAQGSKPVEVPDPTEQMRAIEQLRQVRNQNALAPLRAQELQGQVQQTQLANKASQDAADRRAEDIADDQTATQILEQNGNDWEKSRPLMEGKLKVRNLQRRDADHLTYVKAMSELDSEKRKKVLETSNLLGQELNGLINTPEEDRQAVYSSAKQRLEEQGVLKPGAYPEEVPNIQTLKGYLARTTYASQAATQADKAAKEEKERADAERIRQASQRKDIADEKETFLQGLEALGDELTNDEYKNRRSKLSPNAQRDFPRNLEDPATGRTREKTLSDIGRGVMTAKDRTAADATKQKNEDAAMSAAQRAAVAGGKAGLAARATDPTASSPDRKAAREALALLEQSNARETANAKGIEDRYNRTEQTKDSTAHDSLQTKESDQWALRSKYGDAITKAEAAEQTTITDPKTGKEISIQDAHVSADAARDKALIFQKQARGLRVKHGWGEFAEGDSDSSETPPPATATSATTPAAPGVIDRIKSAFTPPATPSTQPSIGGVTRAPAAPAPQANTVTPSAGGKVKGLITLGNIDITQRPDVKNSDGSRSTVRSMSFEEGGKEILIPTVVGNKVVSDDEAIAEYHKTGKHLGMFDNPDNATAYAKQLHNDYESGKIKNTPPTAKSDIDPSIKSANGFSVGQQVQKPGGGVGIVKGFKKNGKIVVE